jgi:shikimate dehydrogenase
VGGKRRAERYRLGLIGHPVKQSLSPLLHEAALSFHGLDGTYELIDIEPGRLPAEFAAIKKNGFKGINVTIPHKQLVMPLLDEVVDDAKQVGAVNTIVFSGGGGSGSGSGAICIGHNTDVYGFSKSLSEAIDNERIDTEWSKSVLVVGCGGAARAVVAGLCEMGYLDISIFGRDKNKSREFVTQFAKSLGPKGELLIDSSLLRSVESLDDEILSSKFLIVNATPAGQNGEPLPDWLHGAVAKLDKRALVYDLVYSKNDFPTALEECARSLSIASVDGLNMLIYQAARAFEIWTGKSVPPDCMKAGLKRARS